MATMRTIALVALLASACLAQNGNYVDADYDYDNAAPARPAAPVRSYTRPAAQRPTSVANAPRPTPVPILKQINRHNEDGSYTYGYEGADGSFKIETKLPTGEVMGKYGFVDDTGEVRVVEYGANKFGFQPSGKGITVAPPTLVDETTRRGKPGDLPEYDDGQYFEQQAQAPLRPAARARPVAAPLRPALRPAPRPAQQQYATYESFQDEQTFAAPSAAPAPRPVPRPAPLQHLSGGSGPLPARAVVAGAAPAPPSFSGVSEASFARPAPRPQPTQQPVYHAQPIASFAPAPAPAHHSQQPQRPARAGGLLDQLARDYALPSNAAPPLHDISFGFY